MSTTPRIHRITEDDYTLNDLRIIHDTNPRLELSPAVEVRISAGADFLRRKAAEDRHIYGVNTGFGALCETRVPIARAAELQRNLVLSHAAGVGEIADPSICRLTLFLKLLTFRSGHTGISLATVRRLVDLWNRDVIPGIPLKGTVGASGDLAPLAHMTLPLLGLGCAYVRGKLVDGRAALAELGWEPIELGPKEGLALINGVQYITAIAVHCLLRFAELLTAADVIASLSIQAFSASRSFYEPLYVRTSRHPERGVVAANLMRLLRGGNHGELPTCNRSMQDPYSFRCIPQVHGAVRQAFNFAREVMEQECSGVSDNPLFFPAEDQILFGGNLHGESTALALDYMAIAATELASISERRTYQLLSGQRGLPSFLAVDPGAHSGLMVTQYTSAALLNECKVLSTPASVDTIPTCQLQEDHVSMGGTAALKLRQILDNCEYILGIELITAAQAAQLHKRLELSPRTRAVLDELRRHVPFLDADRVMSDDIQTARRFITREAARWQRELELA